ncbi:MAG: HAD-IIA family hydrolase [Theionarchaea archaeon]|nr:HAD-IIA family hydrolase [Theionarchaea archaeon]
MPLIEQLNEYDAFVIDLDGVIYLRNELVPRADAFIGELGKAGKGFVFLTNNSSRTREDYVEKLAGFGIEVALNQVVTSAYATCRYLQERLPGSRVYAVGEEGLRRELAGCGMTVVEDGTVDVVVVGIDLHFTYEKLKRAANLIRTGARFVSTNRDATYPTEEGLFPGAGSIVSAIQTASGRRPINIGKPNRRVFDLCLSILGVRPERAASLGDRFETDILGGMKAGMGTIMVLTGVTRPEDVGSLRTKPDIVVESVGELTTG